MKDYLIGAPLKDLQVTFPSFVCMVQPCHSATKSVLIFKSGYKKETINIFLI